MKTLLVWLIAILSLQNCFAQNKDVATLKQLNAVWIASYVTRDTAKMGGVFAEDLVLTNPSGKTFHKQDILKGVVSPGQECLSSKVDTVRVRLFGNIGIINAEITVVVKVSGKTDTIRTNYMDVYEKRHGRWYAVAAHVTLLGAK